MREHWTATAEYVTSGDSRIIGQDDRGDFWVPTRGAHKGIDPTWTRRMNLRNPLHWSFWVRSRLTNRVAWLESA